VMETVTKERRHRSGHAKDQGGLLVDIGVNVSCRPVRSMSAARPTSAITSQDHPVFVLKIDEARRNIVVSRRALIESERAEKSPTYGRVGSRQRRKASSRNIAEFGAFVDLGASTACCTSPT